MMPIKTTKSVKTLKDVLPPEFMSNIHSLSPARKYANDKVVSEYHSADLRWPGKHKNVNRWFLLERGCAVGLNESPVHGLSFPIIKSMITMSDLRKKAINLILAAMGTNIREGEIRTKENYLNNLTDDSLINELTNVFYAKGSENAKKYLSNSSQQRPAIYHNRVA
jgi:hypothetical protein